jgi:hypothetical protein
MAAASSFPGREAQVCRFCRRGHLKSGKYGCAFTPGAAKNELGGASPSKLFRKSGRMPLSGMT